MLVQFRINLIHCHLPSFSMDTWLTVENKLERKKRKKMYGPLTSFHIYIYIGLISYLVSHLLSRWGFGSSHFFLSTIVLILSKRFWNSLFYKQTSLFGRIYDYVTGTWLWLEGHNGEITPNTTQSLSECLFRERERDSDAFFEAGEVRIFWQTLSLTFLFAKCGVYFGRSSRECSILSSDSLYCYAWHLLN